MLSLQIQPSDTGCSIFILPSNAMNRDIQICYSNSTISRAHNSKAVPHQSKIRYRCSHKCIHPSLSPQEKSPASNTKIVITKQTANRQEGRHYLKYISLAILRDNITSTYPIHRTHAHIITQLSQRTFILSKWTWTVLCRANTAERVRTEILITGGYKVRIRTGRGMGPAS
jgi:hypothetical protein